MEGLSICFTFLPRGGESFSKHSFCAAVHMDWIRAIPTKVRSPNLEERGRGGFRKSVKIF